MNDPKTMNTRISYMYHDANNEKTGTSCVLSGQMSDTMLGYILASLDEDKYFIPEAVGLPACRSEKLTDADHPYCELARDDFEPCTDAPTLDMDCKQLSIRFTAMRGKWNEYAEKHPLSETSRPKSLEEQITDVAVSLLQPITGRSAEDIWRAIQSDVILNVQNGENVADAIGQAISARLGKKPGKGD